MSKDEEYIANAVFSLELAGRTVRSADRQRLLRLAEGWLNLADRAQKRLRSKRGKVPDHPLVKAKLGDEHTDA